VPITVTLVSARASWVIIEPTPPAAASASSVPALSGVSRKRSNSVSHAVIVVSGRAAAAANVSVRGLCPAMRSSTAWNCALVPGRAMEPA